MSDMGSGRSLHELQDEVIDALHRGEPVDRAALVAAHPDHADALERFFDLLEVIEADATDAAPSAATLGDFRIVREIGRGGMGVVYEAEQKSLGRSVALKVLPGSIGRDERLLARFRREARAAGRLRHPGIVPVYAVGEVGDTPFYAMELVEGRSLAEVLKARRGGDAGTAPSVFRRFAVEVAAKVAEALAYAHAAGIVHRDVKPGNILLERDGTPRLTDFGLALDVTASAITGSGDVFGSPQYMSPEQALRQEAPLDARTDVYSLAVTLYECVTGRLPYAATTCGEFLAALTKGAVIPPRTIDPSIEPALERILLKALEKEPRHRYAGAAEFAADLRAFLASRRIAAPGVRRWWKRKVVVAAAVIAGITLILNAVQCLEQEMRARRPPLGTPTRAELAALAADRLENGTERLAQWLRPQLRLRHVFARNEPGLVRLHVEFPDPRGAVRGLAVVVRFEGSIEGGPWTPLSAGGSETAYELGQIESNTDGFVIERRLVPFLGSATSRDSLRLRFRATFSIETFSGEPTAKRSSSGTTWTWTSDEIGMLVYDDYPEDYPLEVTGDEVDTAMRNVVTPDRLMWLGPLASHGDRRRVGFELVLERSSKPAQPVNCASELEIWDVEQRFRLGVASLNRPSHQGRAGAAGYTESWPVDVFLADAPSREEADFCAGLQSGAIQQVRMVVKPSRSLARQQPTYERYWGGTIDVVVPVWR